MKRVRTVLLVTFISMLAWSTDAWAQTGISKAQAMFLYNFSRLVEWPASAKSGDFVIGILGNSSIVEELTAYTQGKKVGVQPIKIIKFKDPEEIINCHILFVSFGKSNKMNEVLAKVGSSSTLIIGEKIGILDEGAAINFTIVANKLKFELNKANATKYGLSISASLENMAM